MNKQQHLSQQGHRVLAMLLVVVVVLFFQNTYAQTDKQYTGYVIDKNDSPLMGVTIRTLDARQGTATNEDGYYSFQSTKDSLQVIFSHIGFVNDTVLLFAAHKERIVTLEENIYTVNEVTVDAQRFKVVAGDAHSMVLDYAIHHCIYVLVKRKNIHFLEAYSLETDHLLKSMELPFKNISKLFMDCFHNVHILSDDAAYQVYYDAIENNLTLIDSTPLTKFNELLKNCVLSNEQYLFYSVSNEHQHSTSFTAIDKQSRLTTAFYSAKDETRAKASQQDLAELIGWYYRVVPPEENIILNGTWDGQIHNLTYAGDKDLIRMAAWYRSISTLNTKCYIFQQKDRYYIYDSKVNKLLYFDNQLELLQESPIDEIKKSDVFVYNATDEKLHHIRIDKGTAKAQQLELNTGKPTGESFRLKYHIYPENISIANNKMFYLHRMDNGSMKLIYQEMHRVSE